MHTGAPSSHRPNLSETPIKRAPGAAAAAAAAAAGSTVIGRSLGAAVSRAQRRLVNSAHTRCRFAMLAVAGARPRAIDLGGPEPAGRWSWAVGTHGGTAGISGAARAVKGAGMRRPVALVDEGSHSDIQCHC